MALRTLQHVLLQALLLLFILKHHSLRLNPVLFWEKFDCYDISVHSSVKIFLALNQDFKAVPIVQHLSLIDVIAVDVQLALEELALRDFVLDDFQLQVWLEQFLRRLLPQLSLDLHHIVVLGAAQEIHQVRELILAALDKVIDRHGFESLDFSFLEGLELVANEQHSNLLILEMLLVPDCCMQDGALVPHVFALIFQLRQVSFFSVFVGKHIDLPEMLALYQIFQGVVCADVLLLQLLEYGLHDDDIAKFGAVLDHIDLVQHGVLVQNVDDFLLGIVELNHRIG